MSETFDALAELRAMAGLLARKLALPDMPRCLQQANARPSYDDPVSLPSEQVVEAIRRKLQAACQSHDGIKSLSLRCLRDAPLVLWSGEPQAAGFPGLLEAFLTHAVSKPRWQRDLIEAWLRDFGQDRLFLREIGDAIARFLADATHPRLVAWRDAHATYNVFSSASGPANAGRILLSGPGEVATILATLGMDNPLRATGGFFRATVSEMLKSLPKFLRGPSARSVWTRARAVLEVTTAPTGQAAGLRFRELGAATAQACLEPWLQGDPPSEAPKEDIKAFLLRVIGDPRLSPERWFGVPDAATKLMRAWLAAASLEAFLSLISQNKDDDQWRYRQAFWRACLRKVPSAEVWVVLGSGLASQAQTIRDLAGGYGKMNTAEQAVLLMRLGNLVLSEWSNVGRVRAWDADSRDSPSLYKLHYDNARLKAPCLDFPDHPARGNGGSTDGMGLRHDNSRGGLWQGCAAALLYNKLQIRLEPRDYMP